MSNIPSPEEVEYGEIITTETIHDSAMTTMQVEVKKSLRVDKSTALQTVIESLGHINRKETRKLVLTIIADDKHAIDRITKQYIAVKETSGRRKKL